MAEVTYAKVGGPPEDWQSLEVRDLDTGQLRHDVIEVNTEEGWALVYRTSKFKLGMDEIPQERIIGRFQIERKGSE